MREQEIRRWVRNGERVAEVREAWVKIFHYLGFGGFHAGGQYERFDERFGPENWLPAHFIDGLVESRYDGYLMYEDGYYHFLKNNPELRAWLVSTASEVYDIQPSNVESGLDYTKQECGATHLQDIAVRRALTRLTLEEQGVPYDPEHLPEIPLFHGDHLVQIRGRKSEGFALNPGEVPFHEPEWALGAYAQSWWKELSVEDVYQRNKVLLVHPEALRVRLAMLGDRVFWLADDEPEDHYLRYQPDYYDDRLFRVKGSALRRQAQESLFSGYCEVRNAPQKRFSVLRDQIAEHRNALRGALARKRLSRAELDALLGGHSADDAGIRN